jgi:hypothetical protein
MWAKANMEDHSIDVKRKNGKIGNIYHKIFPLGINKYE